MGVGTWAGVECVHAAAMAITAVPIQRTARMSVELAMGGTVGERGEYSRRLATGDWRLATAGDGERATAKRPVIQGRHEPN